MLIDNSLRVRRLNCIVVTKSGKIGKQSGNAFLYLAHQPQLFAAHTAVLNRFITNDEEPDNAII